ncbi:Type II secretion system protein D [bacterium HR15]|nr:Type II secretion system protein D [bacterium HR15]
MRSPQRSEWVAIFALLTLIPLWGQQIKAVKAFEQDGQAIVQVRGEQVPRPSVSTWQGRYLVLDFKARLGTRRQETRFTTPVTTYLRYGWFSNNPPRVRVVVTMRGRQPYQVEAIEGGWQVRIGQVSAQQGARPTEAKRAIPEKDKASSNRLVSIRIECEPPQERDSRESVHHVNEGSSRAQIAQRDGTTLPPPQWRHAGEEPRPRQPVAMNPADALPREAMVSLDFVGAEIGDVLKALAIQSGANIVTAPDVKGTITISLNRVSVEEALNLITRLSGYRYERIENTYIVGTPKSIAEFKGSETKSESSRIVEVLTLKQAKASDVAAFLNAAFPGIKVTPSTEKDSNYVLIEGEPNTVAAAKEAVNRFETAIGTGEEIVTEIYRVRFADARDLMRILNQLVPTVSVALGPDAMLSPARSGGSSAAPGMSSGDAPSATAQQMGAAMPAGASTSTGMDKQPPNLLVLMGAPREVQRALEVLQKVDIKQPQVLIEARVMDLSEASLKSLGLSWSMFQSSSINMLDRTQQPPFPTGETTTPNQQGVRFNKDGQLGIDFTIVKQPVDFSATLNALAQDQRNRLLASPRIATLDGRSARIFIGDEINYVKLIQQTQQGANVQTDSVQAGIILEVLPRVHEDHSITLQIRPEVSVITGFLQVPGGGSLPQLARRNAETTIRLNNGETLVIGGLIRESDIKTIQKVPLLGDLPFFGYLFRKTNTQRDRSEVVITLTVRVME